MEWRHANTTGPYILVYLPQRRNLSRGGSTASTQAPLHRSLRGFTTTKSKSTFRCARIARLKLSLFCGRLFSPRRDRVSIDATGCLPPGAFGHPRFWNKLLGIKSRDTFFAMVRGFKRRLRYRRSWHANINILLLRRTQNRCQPPSPANSGGERGGKVLPPIVFNRPRSCQQLHSR